MTVTQSRPTPTRATGRHAAGMKYDLLTALGCFACGGDKHLQRLVLRLMTLIVARYNWQTDEIAVGQREMAALWSVDARTVKRDLARLREMGWLSVRRPATRGRVAVHGLEIAAILHATREGWDRVGADFAARLGGAAPEAEGDNVVPFPQAPAAPPRPAGQGLWPRVLAGLQDMRPDLYSAWFAALLPEGPETGDWQLQAPSRFHASFVTTHHLPLIAGVLRRLDPGFRSVLVRA